MKEFFTPRARIYWIMDEGSSSRTREGIEAAYVDSSVVRLTPASCASPRTSCHVAACTPTNADHHLFHGLYGRSVAQCSDVAVVCGVVGWSLKQHEAGVPELFSPPP